MVIPIMASAKRWQCSVPAQVEVPSEYYGIHVNELDPVPSDYATTIRAQGMNMQGQRGPGTPVSWHIQGPLVKPKCKTRSFALALVQL